MFPKIGVPQNGWFIMENPENPIKVDDLEENPPFSETSIYIPGGDLPGSFQSSLNQSPEVPRRRLPVDTHGTRYERPNCRLDGHPQNVVVYLEVLLEVSRYKWLVNGLFHLYSSRWWFQTFFMFTPKNWGRGTQFDDIIFFRWVG